MLQELVLFNYESGKYGFNISIFVLWNCDFIKSKE